MIKLLKHSVNLLFLLSSLVGCAGMEVADIKPRITLPASQECFGITVLSKKEERLSEADCIEVKKRSVFLDSENWKMLRSSIQRNCQHLKCKQIVGAFDNLFLTIDEALQQLPVP